MSIQSLADSIMTDLGCTERITRAFIEVALGDIKLFDQKQSDYGAANITAFGEFGVLVRSNDKLARLRNLQRRIGPVSNEPVEDSWRDLSVYGVIARMCRMGLWPGVPCVLSPDNTPVEPLCLCSDVPHGYVKA